MVVQTPFSDTIGRALEHHAEPHLWTKALTPLVARSIGRGRFTVESLSRNCPQPREAHLSNVMVPCSGQPTCTKRTVQVAKGLSPPTSTLKGDLRLWDPYGRGSGLSLDSIMDQLLHSPRSGFTHGPHTRPPDNAPWYVSCFQTFVSVHFWGTTPQQSPPVKWEDELDPSSKHFPFVLPFCGFWNSLTALAAVAKH